MIKRYALRVLHGFKAHFVHFKNAPFLIVCCFVKPNQFQKEIFHQDDTMGIDPEMSLMLDYGLDSLDLLDLSFNRGLHSRLF